MFDFKTPQSLGNSKRQAVIKKIANQTKQRRLYHTIQIFVAGNATYKQLCRSVGRSVRRSVRMRTAIDTPDQLINAPAQPPATGFAVYTLYVMKHGFKITSFPRHFCTVLGAFFIDLFCCVSSTDPYYIHPNVITNDNDWHNDI